MTRAQDSALDTLKLPADHVPKFLAEAKRIFEDGKPPFVTTPGNSTAGSRRPVFLTEFKRIWWPNTEAHTTSMGYTGLSISMVRDPSYSLSPTGGALAAPNGCTAG